MESKRGRARKQILLGKSVASRGDNGGSAQAKAEEPDPAVSLPEQQSSGGMDKEAVGCADFSRLPLEVLVTIFRKVNEMTGNQVMLCAEVCKEWHSATASALTCARLVGNEADARTRTSPDEMALGIVKSYPNLKKLCIENSFAGKRGWRHTFETLGKSCPNLQHLTISDIYPHERPGFSQVYPKLVTSDMQALAPCMSNLRSFHFRGHLLVESLPSFTALETLTLDLALNTRAHLPNLDHLPSLLHLTIINGVLPDLFLHNTTNLETLVLQGSYLSSYQLLSSLSSLQSLNIYQHWISVEDPDIIPHLPSLRHLLIRAFNIPDQLDFSQNPQVTSLILVELKAIGNPITWFDRTTALRFSNLTHLTTPISCTRDISVLSHLPNLLQATLIFPDSLPPVPSLAEPFELPPSLELTLELFGMPFNVVPQLASLRPTRVNCHLGVPFALEPLGWLPLVRTLTLDYIPSARILFKLSGLKYLNFLDCAVALPPSASLPSLEQLLCHHVRSMPIPLAHLHSLLSLTLDESWLESIPELPSGLQDLSIARFHALRVLPPLANLGALKQLQVSSCKVLDAVPPLGGLTSLQSLTVSYCPLVRDLPQVAKLCQLRVLDVTGSYRLTSFRSPFRLRSVAAVGGAVHVLRQKRRSKKE